ncbi:MAG: oxygenase MpaB family protein [Nevskiales bacterium]
MSEPNTPRPAKKPAVNFLEPAGEAALIAADSVSWRVFKNPVASFIGGVAAVVLELAEPRVAAGVWNHTTFRTDPRTRLRRTGLAAMVTVYGPHSTAEAMIAGVQRAHDRVRGVTACGQPYHANDPELLDWVQATASYGFVEAYCHYVQALTPAEKDNFYAESVRPARLYGTRNHPDSVAALDVHFEAMRAKLRPSPTIAEFLQLMGEVEILPRRLRSLQRLYIRAAVELLPEWAFDTLGIDSAMRLKPWEHRLVRTCGYLADRIVFTSSPAVQACIRLGLPKNYLQPAGLLRHIRI